MRSAPRLAPAIAPGTEHRTYKFGTKPTEKQMSFADLVRHIATGDTMLCSWIAGQAAPRTQPPAAGTNKDALVAALPATCRPEAS